MQLPSQSALDEKGEEVTHRRQTRVARPMWTSHLGPGVLTRLGLAELPWHSERLYFVSFAAKSFMRQGNSDEASSPRLAHLQHHSPKVRRDACAPHAAAFRDHHLTFRLHLSRLRGLLELCKEHDSVKLSSLIFSNTLKVFCWSSEEVTNCVLL